MRTANGLKTREHYSDYLFSVPGGVCPFLKQKCAGHTAYIFTGNLELAKRVGLKTSRRIPFFNADIECRLLKYELYP